MKVTFNVTLSIVAVLTLGCTDETAPGGTNETDSGADAGSSADVTSEPDGNGGGGGILDDLLGGDSGGVGDAGSLEDTRGSGDPVVDPNAPMGGLFTEVVHEVVIEIDYQSGAAPYTGSQLGFGRLWDLFITNAEAAFAEAPRSIVVPTTLDAMEEITDIEGTDFTASDVLDIAERHRGTASTVSSRTFYIIWLDGYFADDSGRRDTVLGVSIGDSEVIAMFKPVIRNTTFAEQVEQATLVHEFGHAIGLVNNGLPMAEDHLDEANGAHCSNRDCVMFFTVAGPDVVEFVVSTVLTSNTILWGDECLADFREAAR